MAVGNGRGRPQVKGSMLDYDHWRRNGYLSAGDAARALGVPAPTLHRWMRVGKLRPELQGRKHFVKVDDLEAFVRTQFTDPVVVGDVIDSIRRFHRAGLKNKPRRRRPI